MINAEPVIGIQPNLPKAPNVLTRRLRELKPNLAAIGIPIAFARDGADSKKLIYVGQRIDRTERTDRAT